MKIARDDYFDTQRTSHSRESSQGLSCRGSCGASLQAVGIWTSYQAIDGHTTVIRLCRYVWNVPGRTDGKSAWSIWSKRNKQGKLGAQAAQALSLYVMIAPVGLPRLEDDPTKQKPPIPSPLPPPSPLICSGWWEETGNLLGQPAPGHPLCFPTCTLDLPQPRKQNKARYFFLFAPGHCTSLSNKLIPPCWSVTRSVPYKLHSVRD